MNLKITRIQPLNVVGLGAATSSRAHSEVHCRVRSARQADFAVDLQMLVMTDLTQCLPQNKLSLEVWLHMRSLRLADPGFAQPAKVDCVLGADAYSSVILNGLVKGPVGTPVAQDTVWILTGRALSDETKFSNLAIRTFHTCTEPAISAQVAKLWELNNIDSATHPSEEDKRCEEQFQLTHTRDDTGRFIVRLPFARRTNLIGSRSAAHACLVRSERRFQRDPRLAEAYTAFMQEYIRLGHMELVPDAQINRPGAYLPHHGVFCADNPDKIRVVFNVSHKAMNGILLNDTLLPGPKLQADIAVVVSNWRHFKVAGTTDVEKMYRQILVHRDNVDWQRVLWRADPSEAVKEYRCTTVTYGTAAAPFLALRVMKQLAEDGCHDYPEAARVLSHQLYVDDIFFGADCVEEAIGARDQLIGLLATARMKLAK
uniref:Reverse transcriptase domain-containing protein n=1 Tax=Trichogramma kaykai TaxID=54128 RepID=A0ABD2W322_9HYME